MECVPSIAEGFSSWQRETVCSILQVFGNFERVIPLSGKFPVGKYPSGMSNLSPYQITFLEVPGLHLVLYFLYTIRLQAFAWRMARSLRSSNVSSSILNSPSLTYKSSIYRLKEGSPHSTGNMASMSYVKLNGDFVVTLCGVHR